MIRANINQKVSTFLCFAPSDLDCSVPGTVRVQWPVTTWYELNFTPLRVSYSMMTVPVYRKCLEKNIVINVAKSLRGRLTNVLK